MDNHYHIYPEAEWALKRSGLWEKIEKRKENTLITGSIMEHEVPQRFQVMVESGFYKHCPGYQDGLQRLVANPERHVWKVYNKKSESSTVQQNLFGAEELVSEPETKTVSRFEAVMLSGWYVDDLLDAEDLKDPLKLGFDSEAGLVGTVSAALIGDGTKWLDIPYQWAWDKPVWTTKGISGCTHGDLRVYQRDITAYDTTDPMGNKILYRPVLRNDEAVIASHHSTEPGFLATILKWIKQADIEVPMLSEGAGKFMKIIEESGEYSGPFGEVEFNSVDRTPSSCFVLWDHPLVNYSENVHNPNARVADRIVSLSHRSYDMFIGDEKELIIALSTEKGDDIKREKLMQFYPGEANDLLLSLFYQCLHGKGRTLASKYVRVVDFVYSGELEEWQKRMEEFRNK